MYFRSAQKRLSGVFSTPFFFLTQPVHSRRQEHIRVRRALENRPHLARVFQHAYVRQRVFPERKRARRHVCAPASGVTLCPLIPNLNSL